MKKKLLFFALIFSAMLSSCKKDKTDPSATKVSAHTYSVSSWGYSSPNYYTNLPVSELTADNINSAAVMVYYSVSAGVWISVPYTVYGAIHDYHMGFLSSAGQVEVTWMFDGTSSGSDPNTYYSTTVQCKVVVIPQSQRRANPDLDLTNYEAVKKRFNLPN